MRRGCLHEQTRGHCCQSWQVTAVELDPTHQWRNTQGLWWPLTRKAEGNPKPPPDRREQQVMDTAIGKPNGSQKLRDLQSFKLLCCPTDEDREKSAELETLQHPVESNIHRGSTDGGKSNRGATREPNVPERLSTFTLPHTPSLGPTIQDPTAGSW